MKPPACVSCKWGTGTACEKPSNTASSKELEAKLKEMMQARTQQDAKWFAVPTPVEKTTQVDGSLGTARNK